MYKEKVALCDRELNFNIKGLKRAIFILRLVLDAYEGVFFFATIDRAAKRFAIFKYPGCSKADVMPG